ncbi:hypothetical protein BJY52DRAFT_1193826 [Lactarius psammicola]|nr:hypothetical protein BJY52DRAFT_1193826 [Lactarius psammicola]
MSVPSIIKAHLSWTWQCTTLNRGDELVNLLLSCLQPYQLCVPEHMPINGRRPGVGRYLFDVLSLYHETKVPKPGKREPEYNFVLPHREPLRCSIGALAILLHFVFDQEGLCAKTPGWDWSCPSTWRMIRLMFGKTVGRPCSPDTLRKMYTTFLEATTIKSKKLHLARRTMPTVLEEMGVTMDEIDGIGHWASNTRREVYAAKIYKSAVVALAGFYVGEAYHVPWARIPVPSELQTMLFPFVESTLANLKAGSRVNQGLSTSLSCFSSSAPFSGGLLRRSVSFPGPPSSLFRRMKVFTCPGAKHFLNAWPGLVSGTACELEEEAAIASTFSEANTQTAFMSIAARQKEFETALRVQTAQLNVITHRTDPLSPSHKRSGVGAPDSPAPATHSLTLEREEEPPVAHGLCPTPSLPPPPCTHCGHHATSAGDSARPQE